MSLLSSLVRLIFLFFLLFFRILLIFLCACPLLFLNISYRFVSGIFCVHFYAAGGVFPATLFQHAGHLHGFMGHFPLLGQLAILRRATVGGGRENHFVHVACPDGHDDTAAYGGTFLV